jgi:hypothetical protein
VLVLGLVGALISTPVLSSLQANVYLETSGTILYTLAPTLHIDGRWIKNSAGNILFLRGVNKVGFEDLADGSWEADGQGGPGAWSPYAVRANLDKMKSYGFNVVRLIQAVDWWINNEPNYKQHIKDIITWAGERGIYVIFTGYQVRNYFAGGGQDPLPYPPYSLPGSETIIPSKEAFVNWWKDVGTQLGSFPNALFELWNEPVWDPDPSAGFASWKPVVQQCINTIRTVSDNIVLVQWNYDVWWNIGSHNDLSWIQDLNLTGSNILYSTHSYPDGLDAPNHYSYNDLRNALQLCGVESVGNTFNKPVIIGEIGCNLAWTGQDLTNELSAFKNELTVFNDWNLSYLGWWWRNEGQFALLQPNESWIPPPTQPGQILINATAIGGTGGP